MVYTIEAEIRHKRCVYVCAWVNECLQKKFNFGFSDINTDFIFILCTAWCNMAHKFFTLLIQRAHTQTHTTFNGIYMRFGKAMFI